MRLKWKHKFLLWLRYYFTADIRLHGVKTQELIEGLNVELNPDPDFQGPMTPGAWVGQMFFLNGYPVEIIDNSYLSVTVRDIPYYNWTEEQYLHWKEIKAKK